MVMEYIDGVTISQYLKEHGDRIPYTQVLSSEWWYKSAFN